MNYIQVGNTILYIYELWIEKNKGTYNFSLKKISFFDKNKDEPSCKRRE